MMSELSGYQRELLAHIEFMGRFYGVVSRADLTIRFQISDASATRTFQLYNSLAPHNLIYRPDIRRYEWQDDANPIVEVSVEKCVNTLTDGFGDSFAHIDVPTIAVKNTLFHVDLDILSKITRAINRKRVISISYLSKSSPNGSTRDIIPHSIADSGLRWHVRAFDRESGEFRDFVINRIKSVKTNRIESALPAEMPSADHEWNQYIELELQPHPKLTEISSMIAYEYRMISGVLRKRVRKALAGYLLDSWNIDASSDAHLSGEHIMLHLKNTDTLDFSNKRLAPGVT
ncbi:WYL domain-containing protein [Idiomarina sp. HP20-50]|uniref:WYL domain-containing protein n=1 Tax=Idiomarina sp. HP20-50 TaxID=3070813 RepID=UPI00294AA1D7|nr:WYL domain-containing protein [Idiomarina sp. HP20-50]MDV6316256.1 WYL domain-containing protein [Idiomarina sp. HP20-50]